MVIQRAFIQVTGPSRAGKTTFIERLLEIIAARRLLMVARCAENRRLKDFTESSAAADPELRRYRKAGASGVARYSFSPELQPTDAFWETDFMTDYSEAVILEGDLPFRGPADLTIHVARPLPRGVSLFRREARDRSAEHARDLRKAERTLAEPDGPDKMIASVLGVPNPLTLSERLREKLRADVATWLESARRKGPPPPESRWALAKSFAGAERADVVLVNVRRAEERERAEGLLSELSRLRKDEEIFRDIIGPLGSRRPIMARTVDLADPKDRGLREVLRRVDRTIRQVTSDS